MRAVALVLAALAACSRAPREQEPAPLQSAVEGASSSAACGRVIPLEWSYSWPVPALDAGHLRYRIFFYGRDGDPQRGFVFHSPEGRADLDVDGRVLDCRRLDAPVKTLPAASSVGAATMDEESALERRLFRRAAEVGTLYMSGRAPDAAGRAAIVDYCGLMRRLADPGHAADYLALSPGFWAWAKASGGTDPFSTGP